MGKSNDHIRQWKHNRDFLATISPHYSDWFVTVTFYVALHAVDTLLAHDGVTRVNSHSARNEVLIRTNKYKAIELAYLPLYDLSRTVRYLANPTSWVLASDLEREVVKGYLYPIENSVQKLIGQNLKLPNIAVTIPIESKA